MLFRVLFFAVLYLFATTQLSWSQTPLKIVTSIKPLHSLVQNVAGSEADVHLIIKGAASPHDYHLKPSNAQALQEANVIFWIGEDMEVFLETALKSLGSNAHIVALEHILDEDEDAHHEEPGHHDTHDHHAHEKKHDDHHEHHEHHEHHAHKETHDKHHNDHDGHNHGDVDMHLWLNPLLVKKMVHEIEDALIKTAPQSRTVFEKNAQATLARLDKLDRQIQEILSEVKKTPFVVFHDAYQRFEDRYQIKIAGSITISPDKQPSAKRLKEIKHIIADKNAACVFSEPQFQAKMVKLVVEGTEAKSAVLDPLGFDVKAGPDMYFTLMENLSQTLKDCLS